MADFQYRVLCPVLGWRIARITRFSQGEILTENPQRCKDLGSAGPDRGTRSKAGARQASPGFSRPLDYGKLRVPSGPGCGITCRLPACVSRTGRLVSRHPAAGIAAQVPASALLLRRHPSGDIPVDHSGAALNNARHAVNYQCRKYMFLLRIL